MSKHVTSKKREKSKKIGIAYRVIESNGCSTLPICSWLYFLGDKSKKRKKNKFTYSQPVKYHYKRTVQLDIRIKPHATQLGVQSRDQIIANKLLDIRNMRFMLQDFYPLLRRNKILKDPVKCSSENPFPMR